jgi:prepilin-type N-terminal cleavage/methylation domain-containing protein
MTTASIRRGFTLVELLLSLIVTAIVGTALIQMVMSQARFMDQQEAWRGARSVARGGINRLLSDLRAVEAANGVTAAAAGGQDFTVRVPYAFGILCRTNGNNQTLALLPVDSAMFAAAGYSGFAWRNNANGVYNPVPSGVAPAEQANGNDCLAAGPLAILGNSAGRVASINGSPAGKVVIVNGAIPAGTQMGTIFYLYRMIRYEFKASNIVPGQNGLWRTTLGLNGGTEELAAPFAATARVNFYVGNNAVPQAAVPGTLGDIRGLELVLDGMSERAPAGSATAKTANVRTSVFFENRPD